MDTKTYLNLRGYHDFIHYSFQSEFWFPITLAARISFFFFFFFIFSSLLNHRLSSLGLVMMFLQLWRFNLSFEFKPLFIFLILWIPHLCSFKFYLHLNISNWVLIFTYFFHLLIEEFLLLFVLLKKKKKNLWFFVGFAAKYLASSQVLSYSCYICLVIMDEKILWSIYLVEIDSQIPNQFVLYIVVASKIKLLGHFSQDLMWTELWFHIGES